MTTAREGTGDRRFDVRDVAVIGAGPSGLAAAKYLQAQGVFASITVYEQQAEVGGIWNYSARPTETLHVPQESALCPPDEPIWPDPGGPPVFPSLMYDALHTNIPGALMQYSDLAFPAGSLVFPARQAVQRYLVEYSQEVRRLICFSARVAEVRLRRSADADADRDRWDLRVQCTATGRVSERTVDAVVVATGHYATAFVPAVAGLGEFHAAHPGVVTHAKLYRAAAPAFVGKKVVVVGNAASGLDIASQVARVCRRPLLLSARTPTEPEMLVGHEGCEERPAIAEFLARDRGIRFVDGSVETDIDAVVFCTGYLFSFPFLQSLRPALVTDGRRVYGLYKDLLHIEHPTLAFPGLPIKVVPFPLSESQAAIVARAWAGVLRLPSRAEMRQWEEEQEGRRGEAFHVYPKGGDVEYINGTYDWITGSSSVGKEPPRWNERLVWMRTCYRQAKLTFEQTGCKATSLEELGLRFEARQDTV